MKADSLLVIKSVPSSSDIHLWADYIELLCLVSLDGRISKADVLDRIQEESPINKSLEDQDDALPDDNSADLRDNKWERKSDDWFDHLRFRLGKFGATDFYPFEITPDGDTLFRRENLTLKHKLYIFLLVASNLKYTPSLSKQIGSDFEAVSEAALQKCLPEQAEIYIFGTGTRLPDSKKFTGNLFTKITKLSALLNERVVADQAEFNTRDVGDGGADIVAWIPMGDSVPGLLCVFGQCTCNLDDWDSKQHSSSFMAWREKISLKAPPSNTIFIPFCFRNNTGDWWKSKDIQGSILIDRVRLIYLLQNKYDIVQKLPVYADLEKVIAYRADLV